MKGFFIGLLVGLVVLVGFASFPFSVRADCSFDAYNNCSGTCSCAAGTSGTCVCVNYYGYCVAYTSGCIANTPTPPAPTATDIPAASPTATPPLPTTAGEICDPPHSCSTDDAYCNKIKCECDCNGNNCNPGCSSSCLLGNDNKHHCYTTYNADVKCGPPPTPASWSDWECLSGSSDCAGCSNQDYKCAARFCTNPSNSNDYEIICGWPASCSGGGGSTPTNTSAPTPRSIPGAWAKLKNTSFGNYLPALFPRISASHFRCAGAIIGSLRWRAGI